jgi:lactoylglutathione lyase
LGSILWDVCGVQGELSFLWEGLFGCEKVGTFQSEKENVDEDILKLGHG